MFEDYFHSHPDEDDYYVGNNIGRIIDTSEKHELTMFRYIDRNEVIHDSIIIDGTEFKRSIHLKNYEENMKFYIEYHAEEYNFDYKEILNAIRNY